MGNLSLDKKNLYICIQKQKMGSYIEFYHCVLYMKYEMYVSRYVIPPIYLLLLWSCYLGNCLDVTHLEDANVATRVIEREGNKKSMCP